MKKIFFLTALLCASMMSFAYTTEPDAWIGGGGANDKFKWYEIDGVTPPSDVVNIQQPGFASEPGIYVTFADAGFNAVYYNGKLKSDGTDYKQQGAGICFYVSALTKQNTEILIKNGETTQFGLRIYNDNGSTGSKEDPELTINETAVTLDAGTSETFTIVATKADGAGAISYESDKPGIASVDESGVVTAVGRGTAIITVSVAGNDDFEGDSKKLTVTVTGPINWDGVSWLANSNEKYKLVIDPEISDNFGGKRIDGTNLWVGFPSAAFGACSVEYSAVGAGVSFPLSQFPNEFNTFTMECESKLYTLALYYAEGEKETTAIDNTVVGEKAMKVIENGQLIIIKNGVRYNALGAQIQ